MGYNLVKQRDVKFIFQDLMPGDIFIRMKDGERKYCKYIIKSINFRKKIIFIQPVHTANVELYHFNVFEEYFRPFKRHDGSDF